MMPTPDTMPIHLETRPLAPERWPDLERLFGERGACGGCWCMWWRLTRREFEELKGEANRVAFQTLVARGDTPGLLAYADGQPIGWCAIEPRERYPALARSRTLRAVDEMTVWSITCFFVARPWRERGVSARLLRAAVEHARAPWARAVEGYPVEPQQGRLPDAFAWTGTVSAFRQVGFHEVARRSPSRPIMRWLAGEE